MQILILIIATIVTTEIAIRLDWSAKIKAVTTNLSKAIRLMGTKAISDHFKEKMVPFYALSAMRSSLQLLFYLGATFAPFILIYSLQATNLIGHLDLMSLRSFIIILVSSILYSAVRLGGKSNKSPGS